MCVALLVKCLFMTLFITVGEVFVYYKRKGNTNVLVESYGAVFVN